MTLKVFQIHRKRRYLIGYASLLLVFCRLQHAFPFMCIHGLRLGLG